MTTEQLNELGEALCVMSAKSSVLKERDELRALMEENLQGDEVYLDLPTYLPFFSYFSFLLSFSAGSQVALWRTDETHPIDVDQDRHATTRVRRKGGELSTDDLCGRSGSYIPEGPSKGSHGDQTPT